MAAAIHPGRRIARHSTFLSFVLFFSTEPLAAQTPLPGSVSRGLPRQIVTSRTDAQLASLLEPGARNYTVYRFEYGGRMDRARIRRWTGVLLMPQPADLGKLGPVGVATPRGGKATDTWYSHADGTLSKLVLDPAGRTAAVLSV